MLGQQPQPHLILVVVAEVGVGDDGLGQSVALQQRPEVVPEANDPLCGGCNRPVGASQPLTVTVQPGNDLPTRHGS